MHNNIMNLPNSKSPGPDGWPIEIMKSVSEFIAISLSIIFKKSFDSGALPHDWKNALVTPIHKKCARNQTCNYRPVSLTSIFSKLSGVGLSQRLSESPSIVCRQIHPYLNDL